MLLAPPRPRPSSPPPHGHAVSSCPASGHAITAATAFRRYRHDRGPGPGTAIAAATASRHYYRHFVPGPPLLLCGRASRGLSRPALVAVTPLTLTWPCHYHRHHVPPLPPTPHPRPSPPPPRARLWWPVLTRPCGCAGICRTAAMSSSAVNYCVHIKEEDQRGGRAGEGGGRRREGGLEEGEEEYKKEDTVFLPPAAPLPWTVTRPSSPSIPACLVRHPAPAAQEEDDKDRG